MRTLTTEEVNLAGGGFEPLSWPIERLPKAPDIDLQRLFPWLFGRGNGNDPWVQEMLDRQAK